MTSRTTYAAFRKPRDYTTRYSGRWLRDVEFGVRTECTRGFCKNLCAAALFTYYATPHVVKKTSHRTLASFAGGLIRIALTPNKRVFFAQFFVVEQPKRPGAWKKLASYKLRRLPFYDWIASQQRRAARAGWRVYIRVRRSKHPSDFDTPSKVLKFICQ